MLDASCDGLVIAPVMQEETLLLLASEPPAVPYCLIDSPLPGSAPVSTVAQDPFQGGFLAGRMMSLLVITSYSIHYTKLYEPRPRTRSPAARDTPEPKKELTARPAIMRRRRTVGTMERTGSRRISTLAPPWRAK